MPHGTLRFAPHRVLLLALALAPAAGRCADATEPGEATSPYPTLIHLAVEWKITGDDNLNARVAVRYRAKGEEAWKESMPLRRVPAGHSTKTKPIFHWDNKLSGSLFDLKPGTAYEIELALSDPDGGAELRVLTARTRPVPRAAPDAPVRKTDPSGFAAAMDAAQPGDVLLLASGNYGALAPAKDGAEGKPLVLRSESPGGAVVRSVALVKRKHVYLEGLTIEGACDGKYSCGVDLMGAHDCVVRRCTIHDTYGVRAWENKPAVRCYIADNTISGLIPWDLSVMGRGHGEGVELSGPGNVVCFNKVSGYRDCLSHLEDDEALNQVCNDWYNNDVSFGADDGIEADFAMGNCRIVRNRITNCFMGLTSQPGLGGPTYFIRNVMYNLTHAAFKLHRFSQGDVVLHNTVVKCGDGMSCFTEEPFDHAYFRNNLCIGGPAAGMKWCGSGKAARVKIFGPHCDLDYDALGTFQTPFSGQLGTQVFKTLDEMRTGPHERHGLLADMGVFKDVAFPEKPFPACAPPDLRPVAGSAVEDAAELIPGINDAFLNKGPDIGAYEAGQAMPCYGPRPEGEDEETDSRRRALSASK